MGIKEIKENKKKYISLLLLADEQESMIDKYLEKGTMYVLFECGTAVAECVVTDEGGGVLEIKSLAVKPEYQKCGFGKAMIEYIKDKYKGAFDIIQAGTGDSPVTVPFYEKCGFKRSHTIKNFFIDNYDHPIIEGTVKLVDMVYFTKKL